jgi:DNA-binding NtrC family response regulator
LSARVLVVDDDLRMRELLATELSQLGYEIRNAGGAEEALRLTAELELDVVVTDIRMRGAGGIELCRRIAADRPDVPVIVITAFGSLETAIAAIRAGAYDFITKPFEIETLSVAVRRAVEHRRLREEVRLLRARVGSPRRPFELVGESGAMRDVHALLERVADADASVLITGESGTGKELVARALHRTGKRSKGPFVAVNCAAMPEPLLESELFGHTRGAFTDAKESRIGLLAQADQGTLFLDEIGDVPVRMQSKLLRALQERTVRPVGGNAEVPFDARVLAATNRDLDVAIEEGSFREDLYWRINVIHIELPPLRARGGDILLLAQEFLGDAAAGAKKAISTFSPEAAKKLLDYAWPGNVRELKNCVERAVALARFETISVDDLPDRVRSYTPRDILVSGGDPSELVTLEEVEKRYIACVMEAVSGNKVQAARILGIDRTTLYRKLQRYRLMSGDE